MMTTARLGTFLATITYGLGVLYSPPLDASESRPNVIVIMSDDQGAGDYGFQGNELIRTPELDRMHARSACLNHFYVSPVCAPTRASLMTGRYNYRTRCIDTYIGRAMMEPDEVTMAEFLGDAGYATGIYGKWHMGDNYPLRAMDQGFDESLVHRGGGIGQPSDPLGAEGKYTDPTLQSNGREVTVPGYCTDIYFDAAIEFIKKNVNEQKSFFTYIATNAPHGPFHDVPKELYEEYRQVDFSSILIRKPPAKRLAAVNDKLARIAAMITNIDENVGRLFASLDALGIAENTIVVYLNDNGPNTMRFVGEMRGMKSRVDDGGIRSPLLIQWPEKIPAGKTSDKWCAHIDLLPTILDACGVEMPAEHHLDGRSFLPLLTQSEQDWPMRQIVFQSHRGDVPVLYHHFAIHEDPWKLVHPSGFGKEQFTGEVKLELYDLRDDPRQQDDLAADHPDVVKRLRSDYEAWFADVSSTRPDNYAPPRIVIGTVNEMETVLTRQDWRHHSGRPWARDSNGFWLLEARDAGDYDIELIFENGEHPTGTATITVGSVSTDLEIVANQQRGHIARLQLPAGELKLVVDVDFGKKIRGPHQVILQSQNSY